MTVLLFVDAETTGLTSRDTLLEFAYCCTNVAGNQLTPLKSRFCDITGTNCDPLRPSRRESTSEPMPAVGLPVWSRTPQEGQEDQAASMAVESGLFDDWLAAPATHRVTSGEALEQLLLDEISSCATPREDVHLAGAGVAQFDQELLRRICRRVMVARGVFGGPVHYRPVDQSVILMGLVWDASTSMKQRALRWWLSSNPMGGEIEVDVPPRYCLGDGGRPARTKWLTEGAMKHRAAPDVARSIVLHRMVSSHGEWLREALASER